MSTLDRSIVIVLPAILLALTGCGSKKGEPVNLVAKSLCKAPETKTYHPITRLATFTPNPTNDLARESDTVESEQQTSLDPQDSRLTEFDMRDLHRIPLDSFWETVKRDLKAAPSDIWSDTKNVYTKNANLLILGVTYGGSLALQQSGVDDRFEDSIGRRDIFNDGVDNSLAALGNPITHFGLAGLWYLVGQQKQDQKTYDVGRTLFSALTVNGLSSMLGKFATWDKSPNGQYFAFPSGHTSSTFTFASVMHHAYGPWVGIPLYGLGTLVAVERVDNDEHYLSDVIMGGVMGLVIGHTIAGERDIEFLGGKIVPYVDPQSGASGIAWHYQF